MWLLWLQDKLRPVEPSVKGWPKKSEVIANEEHADELKYSRFHRFSSTNCRPHFRLFPAAYSPLYRRYSAGESTDFPRLFRIFCTWDWARVFPQPLRSDFAGFDELSRQEKGRKRSEARRVAEKRTPLAVCRLSMRFPLHRVETFDCRRSPREPRRRRSIRDGQETKDRAHAEGDPQPRRAGASLRRYDGGAARIFPAGNSELPRLHQRSRAYGAAAERPLRPFLQHMHHLYILMHMRTTLNLDDALVEEARRLTGIREKTALVHAGLEALIARESARRLAALGGTQARLRPIPRRRVG